MTDFYPRLSALRNQITKAGFDGFLVPMADEYQSEYVPASAQRIQFLSGFTGSSAFIVVLKEKAAFFTDGRYTLQAASQVPTELYTTHDITKLSPSEWLEKNLHAGAKIGFDPWLHTDDGVTRLKKSLAKCGALLVPSEYNLVDAIWTDRPEPPTEPIHPYDMTYAGQSSADKRAKIATDITGKKLDAAIITDTASVAWILNVRGNDVPNTPLPLSFLIIDKDGKVDWFVDARKITKELPTHLGADIHIRPIEAFATALDAMSGKLVRIDLSESANWITERLRKAEAKIDNGEDPSALARACKNPVELEGMRGAHRRDGAAIASFFCWLNKQPAGSVSELQAEEKLAGFRAANNLYRGPSFDTIAGAGAHGAIVHYRATKETDAKLQSGQLFLLDSGGQYLDGTTDVTRTIAIGEPTAEMRDRFTRVLKGHIALASISFPEGTTGAELDVLARQHLWAAGLDFNHGTGHGVGSYLGVHEGPQGISKRNKVPLKPGMVVSNEPGFYKSGSYGIRIENLQTVVELPTLSGERKMLGFEPLTLVPIDKNLIDNSLMSPADWEWLNTYHARVIKTLRPMVTSEVADWLKAAIDS